MKKIIFYSFIFFLSPVVVKAQVLNTYPYICFIHYQYDNAGNRISRYYECGDNPYADMPDEIDDPNNGGGWQARAILDTSQKSGNMIVFPNPTKGIFYIKPPSADIEDCIVDILDLNGKIILRKRIDSFDEGINISQLANGQYLLKITTGTKNEILKLLKDDQ
jgi:hypothetical protein